MNVHGTGCLVSNNFHIYVKMVFPLKEWGGEVVNINKAHI